MIPRKIFTVFTCLALGAWLSAAPAWSASGRAGGQGRGKGQATAPSPRQQGEAGQQGQQTARGESVRQQQRIELSSEQRHCFDTSARQGDMAQRQARGMAAYARGKGFDRDMAVRQGSALHGKVGEMLREHDRMAAGLGAAERGFLGDRLGTLDRDRDRLQTHLQAMDRELAGGVTAQQFQRRSRALARDLGKWNKHYRRLAEAVG